MMAPRMASTTAMVLAPGCLSTRRKTPRFPFTRTISVWSAVRSSTWATSDTLTTPAPCPGDDGVARTTTSRRGRTSGTWVLVKTL